MTSAVSCGLCLKKQLKAVHDGCDDGAYDCVRRDCVHDRGDAQCLAQLIRHHHWGYYSVEVKLTFGRPLACYLSWAFAR